MDILEFGSDLEVLRPNSLRDAIVSSTDRMNQIYNHTFIAR